MELIPNRRRGARGLIVAFACLFPICFLLQPALRADPLPSRLALVLRGEATTVFHRRSQACDKTDIPDAPLRAFRRQDGMVVALGMHYVNRALIGPSLQSLTLDCSVVMPSALNPDPAAYNDKRWLTATWTDDGQHIAALVHDEFQANTHAGRCAYREYRKCWFNTIVAARSSDGGLSFESGDPPVVVAAFPFAQDVGQGRHRGFFNPSNIVRDGSSYYFFAATTGWEGMGYGACLFRTDNPFDETSWRAWNGRAFAARFGDPYRGLGSAAPCKVIQPFSDPVGAVVRHRPSGQWIAVFQSPGGRPSSPAPGIYYSTSTNLLEWTDLKLLLPGPTLYNGPCAGSKLLAYPSAVDPDAEGRNFDNVGNRFFLFFTEIGAADCAIGFDRDLKRIAVEIHN
ncbi:conserved hypothetical protein [Chelatococcus asaccharovorans]|nr:conserved hypothetical protein [Chelatococcus asaccharovorans]CAH1682419.1 conserved hypothetical protein [Chelatococcus asaccharovorans]